MWTEEIAQTGYGAGVGAWGHQTNTIPPVQRKETLMKRYQGVLSIEEAVALNPEDLALKRALGWLLPMAGADGESEEEGEHEEQQEEEHEEEEHQEGGGEGEHEEGEETTAISLAEYNRLKRVAAEADKARKEAEKEARKRREREQRESGQWQELLDERDETIRTLEAERDEARYELTSFQRRVRVTRAAVRLGFKDPEDAVRFLPEDETEDDASTERALKRLAREKSYLVEQRRSSGAPVNGEGGAGGLTLEEIQRMSPEEINKRWPEVQAAMAAGGARN